MKRKIAIIDYGMGNIQSVANAFKNAGVIVAVTDEMKKIKSSDAVVLPGVGAFDAAVKNLKKIALWDNLPEIILSKPFFGICLGLQLLFEKSEEGNCRGLGILKGEVKKIDFCQPTTSCLVGRQVNSRLLKIPHMGWNNIRYKMQDTRCKIFNGIKNNSYFYFVHSYYVEPRQEDIIATMTDYGVDFCSAVYKDNIFACQFHPEKSGEVGLKLIKNFLKSI